MSISIEQDPDPLDDFSDPRRKCFLCGVDLSLVGSSEEHVIPQWAQRRYSLWDQRLNLLNRTDIKYAFLTVPCCSPCNQQRLKPIEDSLSSTVELGREAVLALGHKTLFLWLGKIFYGVLYKELLLLKDRSDPKMGTIITEDFIRMYRMHRFFLQQARGLVELRDFNPGTIFVFEAQSLKEAKHRWDMVDSIPGLAIGIRVGRVAIVGALADGGAQESDAHIYGNYYKTPLHPIQFREIFARVSYRASLATRTPKYFSMQGKGGPHVTYQMPLGGFSAKPLFEDWIPKDYAQFLAYFIGAEIHDVYEPPDKTRSWLDTPEREVFHMDFKRYPFFPHEPKG